MKFFQTILLLISFYFLNNFLYSQKTAQKGEELTAARALQESDLETQFSTVILKSGKYQTFKVVKREWMDKLKINTLDSINRLETELKGTNEKIATQQKNIMTLEASLKKINEDLITVQEDKDTMSFLGMSLKKSGYKTMMWCLLGILLALLGFFIFKFKNSNTITVQARKALAETEAEFEDHRRRALEREQKVMRKLQDELNRQRKSGAK